MNDAEALVKAFLRGVSFEEGQPPTYDDLPALFADGARLTRTGPVFESWTVDEFVAMLRAAHEAGSLIRFEETELSGRTDDFGNVAQRWSPYAKRGSRPSGQFEATGVISTQFVRTAEGWRISSMAWDDAA